MAKIVHSDAAPSEAVHYSLANVEFELGGRKKSYSTDDAGVLSNAEAHPWLRVERDAPADSVEEPQVAPTSDDPKGN